MSETDNTDESAAQLEVWYSAMSSFGECIVWFQHIEHTLCTCISALAGMTEEIGQIVTSEMSFRVRVTIYSALAQNLAGQDALPEDLAELVKRLRWAEEERNRLVHSVWDLCEENPGTLRREKNALRKNKFKADVENFHPEDFEELQRLFEGICTDLSYLTSEQFPELESKLHY
jgi:hypothetical protein